MKLDAGGALDLLEWKRHVFALYDRIRSSEPEEAWTLWRDTRDRLYREHPQSPVAPDRRAEFTRCRYFDYDPQARALAHVEPFEPVHVDIAASTGAAFPFSKVGSATFELYGASHTLALLWNEGYGGGVFIPFRDETSGDETYAGARYLLDTVKGSDLGMSDGKLVLDFNFAYNPSCAYDSSWACPLAPPENTLPVAVRAGELTPASPARA